MPSTGPDTSPTPIEKRSTSSLKSSLTRPTQPSRWRVDRAERHREVFEIELLVEHAEVD